MKELFKNTWVEEDNGVRIFLLAGTERALIIDTGMTGIDIRKKVSEHTSLPLQLINTHADRDHIAGNGQFTSFYMHPSEAFLYHKMEHGSGEMQAIYEGDRINLGERELQVIHLPGHTPGSITLLDMENRCLIGGDPIQENGDIFMFGPHRDMAAYISSLSRLDYRIDFDFIYPSHGKEKVNRKIIPSLVTTAKAILQGHIKGEEQEIFGHKVLAFSIESYRFLCDA